VESGLSEITVIASEFYLFFFGGGGGVLWLGPFPAYLLTSAVYSKLFVENVLGLSAYFSYSDKL
jgi:hypothetical protein